MNRSVRMSTVFLELPSHQEQRCEPRRSDRPCIGLALLSLALAVCLPSAVHAQQAELSVPWLKEADTVLNPGDSEQLVALVENAGAADSQPVTLTLVCSHPDVTITTATADVGVVPAGERRGGLFEIALAADAEPGEPIDFLVQVAHDGDTWTVARTLTPGDPGQFTHWVTVGDAGNRGTVISGGWAETVAGDVDYVYRMAKYEVTHGQYIQFLNAVATEENGASLFANQNGIERTGSGTSADPWVYGPKDGDPLWLVIPVHPISVWDCCRFANWVANGRPSGGQDASTTENGPYDLRPFNGAHYDFEAQQYVVRKHGRVFVPSEDEWVKATYYKGGSLDAGFWEYPCQSDDPPTIEPPPGTDMVNGSASDISPPYAYGEFTAKPSVSPYGCYDMGGSVAEKLDTLVLGPNWRGDRGILMPDSAGMLHILQRTEDISYEREGNNGLRLASLPEGANEPPAAWIVSPTHGQTVTAPVTIEAGAGDADGTVTKVEFHVSTSAGSYRAKLGEDTTAPYAFEWTDMPAGQYTLTVRAFDDDGVSRLGTVPIQVTVQGGANQQPSATDDYYEITGGATLHVEPISGVLVNDADADGHTLSAHLEDAPAHGSVELNADGSFVYQPDVGFAGTDSFTYVAADGQAESAPATVTLNVAWQYHTFAQLETRLQDYAARFPGICRLTSIGQSVEGRDLWVLRITDNPDVEEDEPEVRYIASIHGNEAIATEMTLAFVDLLLHEYNFDPRITELVDETDLSVLLSMNPDGLTTDRMNANGVDLNRDFPQPESEAIGNLFDGPAMDVTGREPETQAVMQWCAANSAVVGIDFHSPFGVAMYPYFGQTTDAPDKALFEALGHVYADVNGDPMGVWAAWVTYLAHGSLLDWAYAYLGEKHLLVEFPNGYMPSTEDLGEYWQKNAESMLAYTETVQSMGVRGVVTGEGGDPVFAKVAVAGNAQPVFSDPDVGDYQRMLLPGTYTLTFSAVGYDDVVVEDVVVEAGTRTQLDVQLGDHENTPPVADDQAVSVYEGDSAPILLTASDIDRDDLTYAVVAAPEHGDLGGTPPNLTYTPDPGYTGADSFTFKANDGEDDSNIATVSITVDEALPYQITGSVTLDGQPLAGAYLDYSGPIAGRVTSRSDGSYVIGTTAGTVTVVARYGDAVETAAVQLDLPPSHASIDFAFTTATVSGTVADQLTGDPVPGAEVVYTGAVSGSTVAGAEGEYSITHVYGRSTTLELVAKRPGFYFDSDPVTATVPPDAPNTDIQLAVAEIQVTPTAFDVTASPTETVSRTLTIENVGGAELTWSGWEQSGTDPVDAPGAVIRQIPYPVPDVAGPSGAAFDGDGIWMNRDNQNADFLVRVDPQTGALQRTLDIRALGLNSMGGLTWDGERIWISARSEKKLIAIDPDTGAEVRRLDTPDGLSPTPVAWDGSALWVSRSLSLNRNYPIYRIDPVTGAVLHSFNAPDVDAIIYYFAWYAGSLWLLDDDFLRRVDPSTGAVQQSVAISDENFKGIAPDGAGNFWLTNWDFGGDDYVFLIASGELEWISLAPAEGTVPGQTSTDVTVDFDAAKAGLGTHRALVHISSNDPETPNLSIPVTFVVTDDGDRLPNDWEQQIIDADPDDDIESVHDVLPGDDFDGDGRTNFEEYAFCLDPLSGVEPNQQQTSLANDAGMPVLDVTIHLRSDDANLSYTVETCTDLAAGDWTGGALTHTGGTWSSAHTPVTVVSQTEESPGVWSVTLRLPVNDTAGFLRTSAQ